jgi:hypothetical protein
MQPEVHYHAHNTPWLFPVLSHTDPFHAPPCCFFNVRFNIILSSRPPVSKNHACVSVPLHATCPAHSPWCDHLNDVWCGLQTMKLLIIQSSPVYCHFLPLSPTSRPQHLFSKTLSLCSYLIVRDQVSHPCETEGSIIVLCTYYCQSIL